MKSLLEKSLLTSTIHRIWKEFGNLILHNRTHSFITKTGTGKSISFWGVHKYYF